LNYERRYPLNVGKIGKRFHFHQLFDKQLFHGKVILASFLYFQFTHKRFSGKTIYFWKNYLKNVGEIELLKKTRRIMRGCCEAKTNAF
jgi:hypothetical protein